MSRLEDIIEYGMDEMQAKAFKLALLWEEIAQKEFPGYPHVRLKLTGDPRKSILFRYCYKLVRETKGIIPDEEYQLYMRAQLAVIKSVVSDKPIRIDPVILVGEKAWRRWRFWKRRYDKQMRIRQNLDEVQVAASTHTIRMELEQTRKFLAKEFGGKITQPRVEGSIKDKSLIRWVNFDNVSPYYVVLSPWVKESLHGADVDEVFLFDTEVCTRSVTAEVLDIFRKIFPEEDL